MGNYEDLKQAIAAIVKQNGRQEITGDNMQGVLFGIVNSIGANSTFAGIATPDTIPPADDANVFYIAAGGTYPNFNAAKVKNLAIFTNADGTWQAEEIEINTIVIDDFAELDAMTDINKTGVYDLLIRRGGQILSFGTLAINADAFSHVINQTIISNLTIKEDGTINGDHTDGEMRIIYRVYNRFSSTMKIPRDTWTKWNYIAGYSKVVQETGESTTDVMSQKATTEEINIAKNGATAVFKGFVEDATIQNISSSGDASEVYFIKAKHTFAAKMFSQGEEVYCANWLGWEMYIDENRKVLKGKIFICDNMPYIFDETYNTIVRTNYTDKEYVSDLREEVFTEKLTELVSRAGHFVHFEHDFKQGDIIRIKAQRECAIRLNRGDLQQVYEVVYPQIRGELDYTYKIKEDWNNIAIFSSNDGEVVEIYTSSITKNADRIASNTTDISGGFDLKILDVPSKRNIFVFKETDIKKGDRFIVKTDIIPDKPYNISFSDTGNINDEKQWLSLNKIYTANKDWKGLVFWTQSTQAITMSLYSDAAYLAKRNSPHILKESLIDFKYKGKYISCDQNVGELFNMQTTTSSWMNNWVIDAKQGEIYILRGKADSGGLYAIVDKNGILLEKDIKGTPDVITKELVIDQDSTLIVNLHNRLEYSVTRKTYVDDRVMRLENMSESYVKYPADKWFDVLHEMAGQSGGTFYFFPKQIFKGDKVKVKTSLIKDEGGVTKGIWLSADFKRTSAQAILPKQYDVYEEFTADNDYAGFVIWAVRGTVEFDVKHQTTSKAVSLREEPSVVVVAASDAPAADYLKADFKCDGVNDEVELQRAIDMCGNTGTIQLTSGTYNIDAFTPYDGYARTALMIKHYNTPQGRRNITIKGVGHRKGGTIIHVNESAFADIPTTEQVNVINAQGDSAGSFFWGLNCYDLRMELPNANHACCMINNQTIGHGIIRNVVCSCIGLGTGVMPVENLVGIRSYHGWDTGYSSEWSHVSCNGFYEGFQLGGEHHVCIELHGRFNYYCYTFGNYDYKYGTIDHSITMINCCDEHSAALPKFVRCGWHNDDQPDYRVNARQDITMISFNLEITNGNPAGVEPLLAEEVNEGSFCGRIDFTNGGVGVNSASTRFWKKGSGKNFRTTNLAHAQSGTTATRKSYVPTFMQRFFDTDLKKELICIDEHKPTWVDFMGNVIK